MSKRAYKALTGAEVHPDDCDHLEIEVVETAIGEFRRCARCRQLRPD